MKQADLGLNDEQLQQRQAELQEQVKNVMSQLGIEEILRLVGDVRVVGSAEIGLMVWPDIDIEVLCDGRPELASVLKVVERFMEQVGVTKVNLADHRDSVDENLPKGIYLGPDILFNSVKWQMDIWFINRGEAEQRRELVQSIVAKLNNDNRQVILRLKQKVAASDKYHRGVSSVDLYTAVLDENVRDLAGFERYLAKTGRSL